MEQIILRNGALYYGEKRCRTIDDAYKYFRKDYHTALGKETHGRLDRLGQRKERIHGYGFVFSGQTGLDELFHGYKKIDCMIMGLMGISYVRVIGLWDYNKIPDDLFEDWFDWAFTKGNKALRTVGTKCKVGRTSKRLKTRYR